jgi:hypothetical protein
MGRVGTYEQAIQGGGAEGCEVQIEAVNVGVLYMCIYRRSATLGCFSIGRVERLRGQSRPSGQPCSALQRQC